MRETPHGRMLYMNMYIMRWNVSVRRSIAEARRHLPGLVREAESGRTVELTRRGKPVAVLVGLDRYRRLASARPTFTEAYDAFRRGVDLADLDIDPAEVFGGVREVHRGRRVDL